MSVIIKEGHKLWMSEKQPCRESEKGRVWYNKHLCDTWYSLKNQMMEVTVGWIRKREMWMLFLHLNIIRKWSDERKWVNCENRMKICLRKFDMGIWLGLNWPDPLCADLGFVVRGVEPSECNCVMVVVIMICHLCYSHQDQVLESHHSWAAQVQLKLKLSWRWE